MPPFSPATVDASPLDSPPPSPTPMGGGGPGTGTGAGPFSMRGLAPGAGGVPSSSMPPEILTGLLAAAQTINQQLDSFAQVTPDKATALALIKDLLQQYLADVLAAGAGPTSPTAAGPAFPGGGLDRGLSGAGAV